MRWNEAAHRFSALLLAAAGLSCGGGDGGPEPAPTPIPTTVTTAGSGQTGFVGETLPLPISVSVFDQDGDPIAGVPVAFAVTTGGGGIADPTTTTTSSGVAATTWTLGTAVGLANNVVVATVTGYAGAAPTFTANGAPGHPATIGIVSGDFQTGTAGTVLSAPLVVEVRDAYSHPVPGATVQWSPTAGGGSVSAITTVTAADGRGGVTRTLGPVIGDQLTTAAVALPDSLATVTFYSTALTAPGPAPRPR